MNRNQFLAGIRKETWTFILPTFLANTFPLGKSWWVFPSDFLSSVFLAWIINSEDQLSFHCWGFLHNSCHSQVHGCDIPPPTPRMEDGAQDQNISEDQVNCIKYKNLIQTSSLEGKNPQLKVRLNMTPVHPIVTFEGLFLGLFSKSGESKTVKWTWKCLFWMFSPPIRRLWSQIQGNFPSL